jgi:hypothetical protein
MYQDNLDDYDRIITLDELIKEVDEEHENMSEEEKYCRLRDCNPTFLHYCLSMMHFKKLDKALVNEFTYKFEKM